MDEVDIEAINTASFVYAQSVAAWGQILPLADGVFRGYMRRTVDDSVVQYSWASDASAPGTIAFAPSAANGNIAYTQNSAADDWLQLGGSLVEFVSAGDAVTIAPSSVVTISIPSGVYPGIVSWTDHQLPPGTPVKFSTSGALPTGITASTIYYVSAAGLGANSFQIAATLPAALAGGPNIDTSGSQSGTQTCTAPTTILWTGHGLSANQPVRFHSTGALPTGLTAWTPYYISASLIETNSFQVAATPNGSVITTSGTQSGISTALGGNTVLIGATLVQTLANLLAFLTASLDAWISQCTYSVTGYTLGIIFKTTTQAGNYFALATSTENATPSGETLYGGGGMLTMSSPVGDLANFLGDFSYDVRWEYEGSVIYIFGGTITLSQGITR